MNVHNIFNPTVIKKVLYYKLRIVMALIFLWAFFDKLFGLGFSTTVEKAWIHGGSPTYGFLMFATKGPLASFFQSLAGFAVVDWLFMLGLLGVGITLLCNRFVVIGSIVGAVMVFLMWLAVLPPANNPILDDHIVYMLVFFILGIYDRETKRT